MGATHPLTIDTREQLIALLRSMGSTEEAAQLERAQPRLIDLLSERTPAGSIGGTIEQSAVVAGTWSSDLPVCPQCQQTTEIIKSGKNRSGSQRFLCRTCQLYFTPQPGSRQPDQARKAQALALAEQGMSYRQIARQLGVHHQTVSAWINPHGAREAE